MELRQRHRGPESPTPGADPGAPDRLQGLRERANALLAAGDRAIEQALSGDCQKFNEATKQHGGQ